MHRNKRKSLEFLKKKKLFYVTILFLHKSLIRKKYTSHHYNEDELILVRLKIDNTYYISKGFCAFCSKLGFFADILLMKSDFTNFFSFWTFISYQTLLQDNVRLFANLTNKTPKKERLQCIFCLIRLSKQEIMLKNTRIFFSLWKPYQKKYNEVYSSLLYYK